MLKFFSLSDKESDYPKFILHVLIGVWSAIIGLIVLIGIFFFPDIWVRWIAFFGTAVFMAVSSILLSRYYSLQMASWWFVLLLWIFITIPCYTAGGIEAPGIITQVCVILTAGILLNWRGGLIIGILSILADFYLAYLEMNGMLPVPTVMHTPLTRWIGAIIPFGTIIVLQYFASYHMQQSLAILRKEIELRKQTEKSKDKLVYDLKERVKELRTLYEVCHILQEDDSSLEQLLNKMANILPHGWQYPEFAACAITFNDKVYQTANYSPSPYSLKKESYTNSGDKLSIEIVYLRELPHAGNDPFLPEETNLLVTLISFFKIEIERRAKMNELKDYKYALDMATLVGISDAMGEFTYVNDNFCKVTQYSAEELIGKPHSILWSGQHSEAYFNELSMALQNKTHYIGEFCNRRKDGSLYWVLAAVIPFVNEQGKIYQYLSINQDITEKKEAEEKSRQSALLLQKITSQIPGNCYMFDIDENGNSKVLYMSKGTDLFNHGFNTEDVLINPDLLQETLLEEDKAKFNETMRAAYHSRSRISFQYRIVINGNIRWRWMQALPEVDPSGMCVWYASTSDVTPLVDYINTIEQILFDISHVLRRPIANIIGLTQIINDPRMEVEELKSIASALESVGQEMEKFTVELNTEYQKKRKDPQFNINVSLKLDLRESLFKWSESR